MVHTDMTISFRTDAVKKCGTVVEGAGFSSTILGFSDDPSGLVVSSLISRSISDPLPLLCLVKRNFNIYVGVFQLTVYKIVVSTYFC